MVTRIARGEFIATEVKPVQLTFLEDMIKIHDHVMSVSPHLPFVIWSLSCFRQLFHDVPVNHLIFIEVNDRQDIEPIRERLYEIDLESVIEPGPKEFAEFHYKNKYPVIVLKRRTRYGCQVVDGIETAILDGWRSIA